MKWIVRWAGLIAAIAILSKMSASLPAVEKDAVDRAIQRGVGALRQSQDRDGSWAQAQPVGMTALAALTLLECDVPASDPTMKLATKYLRALAPNENHTYSLALAILFFDRLGEPVDAALIESMTARLMAGQNPKGGWSYDCPLEPEAEREALLKRVDKSPESSNRPGVANADKAKPEEKPAAEKKRLEPPLAASFLNRVRQLASQIERPQDADNSNTQFATIGLWVARRHGLPVESALGLVGQHFRATQQGGAWSYMTSDEPTATMTAAGALCLAIVDGATNDVSREKNPKALPAIDIRKDSHLILAIQTIATVVGQPVTKPQQKGLPVAIPQVGEHAYYFLWTLERICVALDLKAIGTKDWYNWGAEILLANQKVDGNWEGDYRNADTCFALLFLRRANLTKDLTISLKAGSFETTLKSVGGDSPKAKALKSPIAIRSDAKAIDTKLESGKLAKALVDSAGGKRESMIEHYRDGKGTDYTEALATAISHLDGQAKNKAREALAERLARMKADTLTAYLKDDEPEIRRAAALACALKESKPHVAQLIEMLRDKDATVERAAVAALKDLTRQNFGPAANASPAERDKAIAAWQEWWKKQPK